MSRIRQRIYAYVDEWKSLREPDSRPDLEAIAYHGITTDSTSTDAKVLQWTKNNCAHLPHFVKVINPTAAHRLPKLTRSRNSTYLDVPVPFVQAHFKELERIVTLENHDGRTWRASFGSGSRWCQGWARVVEENNLKPGDVVGFVLVSISRFRFTLFDEEGYKSATSPLNDAEMKEVEPSLSSHTHPRASTSSPDLERPSMRRRSGQFMSSERRRSNY